MRRSTRVILIVLVMILAIGLIGCNADTAKTTGSVETTDADQTTQEGTVEESTEGETLSPEEQILQDRRDIAEAYMRSAVSLLWRASEDIDYQTGRDIVSIKAGRLYEGILYTYAAGTMTSFLEYAGEPDEKGIYTISNLSLDAISGSGSGARIGSDCSSTVLVAWSLVSPSVTARHSKTLCEDYGCIKVGNYTANPSTTEGSVVTAMDNGKDVMAEAYAQMQKADALVFCDVGGSNHTMMVVDVSVVYGKDGKIDPKKSVATVLEQTSTLVKSGSRYEHETLGETVYRIGVIDQKYTFNMLYDKGYLPYTCKEFIDPSTIEEPYVTDSESTYGLDNLLVGTISSNWKMDAVTVTIKDAAGNIVQEATGRTVRHVNSSREFKLQQFVTDPAGAILGKIDPNALAAGQYKCTVVCRLMNGREFVVRDFEFAK